MPWNLANGRRWSWWPPDAYRLLAVASGTGALRLPAVIADGVAAECWPTVADRPVVSVGVNGGAALTPAGQV